jgi:hypothetical protein
MKSAHSKGSPKAAAAHDKAVGKHISKNHKGGDMKQPKGHVAA